jgi:hypothetical protein
MIGWVQQALKKKYDPQPVPASLFSRGEGYSVGSIAFDLLLQESHGLEFEASQHAIEDGSEVTDHVTRKLREVTVSAMFSLHSLSLPEGSIDMSRNRALEQLEAIERLAEERRPTRLVTALKVYPEMLILGVRYERTGSDGEAIRFQLVMREIRKVRLKEVVVDSVVSPPNMDSEVNRRAAVAADAGRVSAETVAAARLAGLIEPSIYGGF